MFLGTYYYRLDEKGRVSIPAKFRKQIGTEIIIFQGFDECLVLYPKAEFEELIRKLKKLPFDKAKSRQLQRLISAGAEKVEFDKYGRIRIPSIMREFASLKKDEVVIIIGVINHLEIWNKQTWKDFKEKNKNERIVQLIKSLKDNKKN